MPAAASTPGPRDEEWYFSSWEIQSKIWPITKGKGVTIAVLDSGVNANLPDLTAAIVPGADSTGNSGGDGQEDTEDGDGHGTGMAALIVGQGIGPARMMGVAPEAKVMPVRSTVGAWDEGIRYAVDHGAKVINISQGTPNPGGGYTCDIQTQQAISYTLDHDVVVVASAGNHGDTTNQPEYPATCAGVLAVGAVDSKNNAWSDTQRQPYVTVAGPGVMVQSLSKRGIFTRDQAFAHLGGQLRLRDA